MKIYESLKEELETVDTISGHDGYWYSVKDVLIILIMGVLCKQQKIVDIHAWANSAPTRNFLNKEFGINKIMSMAQIYNIMRVVNIEEFKLSFIRWMQGVLGVALPGKTVSLDGKTICSTDKLTKNGSILNIVSAYVSELKLTIGSHECMSKPGEREAFRELLAMLNLADTIVVADALHCNKPTIEAILKAEANYLLVAKDNAPTLKQGIKDCLESQSATSATTKELNGGRIEIRTAHVTTDLGHMKNLNNWPNLKTVGAIHRQFENVKHGHKSSEWHYYISSASLTPEQLLHHARMEWGVESMHWLLDVHFQEDKTGVFDMNVQKLLNIVRKVALNLIQIYKDNNCKPRTPLVSIMRANLFDLDVFSDFLDFFRRSGELE
jgi:predicted transposase YbfD/YdcC